MEDLKHLTNKNNVLQLTSALQKVAKNIRTEKNDGKAISNIREVDFLKQQCFDENTQLSLMAFHTFVRLVEDGTLDTPFVLSMFISMLPSASKSQYTAVSEGVISLLLLDLKRRSMMSNTKYLCPFGIKPPQHPIIMLFQKKEVNVLDLVNKINGICGHHDKDIRINSVEFLRPVFLYVLCNPTIIPDSKSLWTCLLSHSNNNQKVQSLIHEILGWVNVSTRSTCLYANIILTECLNTLQVQNQHENRLELTVYLTNLIEDLIRWGYDPRPSISVVFNSIYQDLDQARPYLNIMLVALATILQSISPAYLTELTRLLRLIIVTADAGNRITLNMVMDGLIIWIAHPQCVPEESLADLNSMMKHIKHTKNIDVSKSKTNLRVKYFHTETTLCLNLATLSERMLADDHSSDLYIESFIKRLKATDQPQFRERINLFLRGIFLLKRSSGVHEILLEIVRAKKSAVVIELIRPWLYKLLNEKSPIVRLELLKGLPQFAVVKENIPIILNTLQSISTGSMQPLAMDLYLSLWKCEERTYPFLQKHLSCDIDNRTSAWELNVSKAYTIRDICQNKPSKHGTDLVVHLSNILNECSKEDGETATSIALDAIIALCYSHTVNIASTWNALRAKFEQESRPRVLLSLCEFFGKVPMLYSPTAEYEQLLAESIAKLWNFVVYADDARIIIAALNALQNYDHNSLRLSDLPEDFRQNISLPSEFLKNLQEGEPEPDPVDVLTYVPGECWLQVLQFVNHSASEAASDLVSHYIRTEVDAFKSGMYILAEGHPEPKHVNRLSRQSPLKAVLKHLLGEAQKLPAQRNCHLLFYSLRSISFVYAKPMPALQWTFLVEFMQQGVAENDPEIKRFCLHILANQMEYSTSATQMLESFLVSLIDSNVTDDDLVNGLELMPKIAVHLVDDLFTRYMEFMFEQTYKMSQSNALDNDCWFGRNLDSCLMLLKNPNFTSTATKCNFDTVVNVLVQFFDRIEMDSMLWPKFQSLFRYLSVEEVELVTVPKDWRDLTTLQFMKAVTIRCDLVQHSISNKSWSWLNALVDYVYQNNTGATVFLEHLTKLLNHYVGERDVCHWAMDVLSKIQSILSNEPNAAKEPGFLFLLDIFHTIVVVRSGFDCFMSNTGSRQQQLDIFPESLHQVTTLDVWKDCEARVYEFIYNVFVNSMLPENYIKASRNVLLSFKSRPYFVQKSAWMKFVGLRR